MVMKSLNLQLILPILLLGVLAGCNNRYANMTNLEIIKSTYEGKNSAENGKNLQEHLAANATWTEATGFPYGGTYTGFEEIAKNVFSRLGSEWVDYKFVPEDYVAQGDKVVAYGTYSGTYKETGNYFEARVAHVWKLNDGKIISFEQFVDSKTVIEAMKKNTSPKMKLIYVMDPLCGWCYGNHQTIERLYQNYKAAFDFEILPAGMWSGVNARKQTPQMARYFINHDAAIAQRTGTSFGEAYFQFIQNEEVNLDSEVPSRAIMAVTEMDQYQTVPFMVEVQKARYYHGKDLNQESTYTIICQQLGVDEEAFLSLFRSEAIKKKTQETFAKALQYAQSYPTLLLEANGDIHFLEQGYAPYERIETDINDLMR